MPKPKEKWSFLDRKSEEMKHRIEWCTEANRYRCMRCGRGSEHVKLPGRCTGPKFLSKSLGKWRRCQLETNASELLLTGTEEHRRIWQNAEKNSNSRERKSPPKEANNWRIEREKKRITRNEYQRLFNYFDTEGNGTKMPMELGKGEYHEGKR